MRRSKSWEVVVCTGEAARLARAEGETVDELGWLLVKQAASSTPAITAHPRMALLYTQASRRFQP